MALPETSCPRCGRPTDNEQHCADCGGSEEAPQWLEVGQTYGMTVKPEKIGLDADADEVKVDLEMTEMWETYKSRRVFLAHPLAVHDASGEPLDDDFESIRHDDFVVEQETAYERSEQEVLPVELEARLRRPIFRDERAGKVISVYSNDCGLALDEVVEVATGRLNLAQVRGLFLPVLDAVSELHDEGLLHLRITPWTVRVRDRADEKGLPLSFLRDTMGVSHGLLEHSGLGEEDTFSESEEISEPQVDRTAEYENPFAASRDDEKTRDDVMPLVMADMAPNEGEPNEGEPNEGEPNEGEKEESREPVEPSDSGGLFISQSEASLGVQDDSTELEVLFDNIDGFFRADGDFDEVPTLRGFSPPEIMGRSRAQIGECCDVFNLGMLLYFLIAGQLPPVSVYTRHIPAVPARNLRPAFPPGLQSVIGRATRPDPNERYPDVKSLQKAFDRACDIMKKRAEVAGPDSPRMTVAVDTHVGIAKQRRNPVNQDAVFGAASDDQRFSLMVVADGVSTASYGSGDLASAMLAEEAEAAWEELLPTYLMDEPINPTAAIQDILNKANDRLVNYVNAHFLPFRGGPHEVMGSTALVAILHDGLVTLAALGDSRVYLHRGEAFEQLTIDHNLWTLSILEGVPADNALAMPHGDALARCLGTFIIDQERLEAVHPEADVFQFPVTKGDTLLLTTDGLVDFAAANMLAAEDNIHQVLVSEPDPALACLELILLANRGGGGDNIGVGIVKFE
jgi:protein phosphatase